MLTDPFATNEITLAIINGRYTPEPVAQAVDSRSIIELAGEPRLTK
jgi:hypothetical protein